MNVRLITVFFAFFVASSAYAEELSSINLRPGVTEISRDIFDLHMFVLWICVGIGVVVYGIMVWSLWKYRRSKGAKAAKFTHSTTAEIIWTTIPIIILVVLAVPSVQLMEDMYDTSEAEIDILVTGYQWKWKYEYLGENISYFSTSTTDNKAIYEGQSELMNENYLLEVDNELVVPTGKKIRFLVTSNDVLHSWWVPDFAVKRDAIPGYVNEAWTRVDEPGIYRGQCAELCGRGHAFMPIVVRAVGQQEYDEWINSQKSESEKPEVVTELSIDELLTLGEQKYLQVCAACHLANGKGNVPVFPALVGNEIVNADDKEEIIKVVYFGRRGTAMQAFNEQLTLGEIASILTYVRNSWGNKASVIQPTDVLEVSKNDES